MRVRPPRQARYRPPRVAWWSVGVLVGFLQTLLMGMRVRVAGAVVTVLVLVLNVLVRVQKMRVRVRHVTVLVLMTVRCVNHFCPIPG